MRATALKKGVISDVARAWCSNVRGSKARVAARDLYTGPNASVARIASKESGASWYVVSAGLGLVHSSARVPAYDLSISGSTGRSSVLQKIKKGRPPVAQAWWRAMNNARSNPKPLKCLIEKKEDSLVVLALSQPYFHMVSAELCELDTVVLKRVRIVGLQREMEVPERLRHLVMPYDTRLNGRNSKYRGPMRTIALRAARHFLQLIDLRDGARGARAHAERVKASLSDLCKPKHSRRSRVDDLHIAKLIARFRKNGTQSMRLGLQQLRREHLIACEDKRFERLWKKV